MLAGMGYPQHLIDLTLDSCANSSTIDDIIQRISDLQESGISTKEQLESSDLPGALPTDNNNNNTRNARNGGGTRASLAMDPAYQSFASDYHMSKTRTLNLSVSEIVAELHQRVGIAHNMLETFDEEDRTLGKGMVNLVSSEETVMTVDYLVVY